MCWVAKGAVMFCIGGDDVYAAAATNEADRLAGGGGWNNTNPDEEPPEEMDQSDDEAGGGGGDGGPTPVVMGDAGDRVVEELIFPDPVRTALIYDPDRGGAWFHFERKRIPHALQTLPPQVLKAMSKWKEAGELLSTAIALRPAMPMPVHSSPLLSLLDNQHLPDEKPEQMMKRPPTWRAKYTSWAKSCIQLYEWKVMALERVVTLHPSMTNEVLEQIDTEYERQSGIMEENQNAELDTLYENAANGSANAQVTIERFISLLEKYSIQFIHLLEYEIYSLLVAPYGTAIGLDWVLTPLDTPSLDACQACDKFTAAEVVRDMRSFLRNKYATRAAQQADENAEVSRFKPRLELLYDATAPEPGKGEHWRGYMPREVLLDYLRAMDVDQKLPQ